MAPASSTLCTAGVVDLLTRRPGSPSKYSEKFAVRSVYLRSAPRNSFDGSVPRLSAQTPAKPAGSLTFTTSAHMSEAPASSLTLRAARMSAPSGLPSVDCAFRSPSRAEGPRLGAFSNPATSLASSSRLQKALPCKHGLPSIGSPARRCSLPGIGSNIGQSRGLAAPIERPAGSRQARLSASGVAITRPPAMQPSALLRRKKSVSSPGDFPLADVQQSEAELEQAGKAEDACVTAHRQRFQGLESMAAATRNLEQQAMHAGFVPVRQLMFRNTEAGNPPSLNRPQQGLTSWLASSADASLQPDRASNSRPSIFNRRISNPCVSTPAPEPDMAFASPANAHMSKRGRTAPAPDAGSAPDQIIGSWHDVPASRTLTRAFAFKRRAEDFDEGLIPDLGGDSARVHAAAAAAVAAVDAEQDAEEQPSAVRCLGRAIAFRRRAEPEAIEMPAEAAMVEASDSDASSPGIPQCAPSSAISAEDDVPSSRFLGRAMAFRRRAAPEVQDEAASAPVEVLAPDASCSSDDDVPSRRFLGRALAFRRRG